MEVYIVEWASADIEYDEYSQFEINAFAKTADGRSVVLRIEFFPYFFVKTPDWSPARQKAFLADAVSNYKINERFSLPVQRKDAWGYSTQPQNFVQLAFDTLKAQRICRSRLAKTGMQTFEGNVDPVVRLCHVRNISPTGWVSIQGFSEVSDRTSENAVIQIACSFQRLSEDAPYRNVVVCLDETSGIDTAEIISVGTEADLYTEWIRVLTEEKVDIFMGWNTWQFDWKYIIGRQAVLTDDWGHDLVDLSGLGRGSSDAGNLRTWELNSGAYGQNSYSLVKAPGILDLDLMQLVKREKKLDSYALNNVAKLFLNDSKLDLPATEIFRKFRGSPDDRADIARYAVQDVLLPLRLFAKLNMYDNLAQMSVATCVPMDYLLSRGQQIKVFSLILRQAKSMGYILPDDKKITIDGKFEGATVLQAKKGAYFDVISGLDFASREFFKIISFVSI